MDGLGDIISTLEKLLDSMKEERGEAVELIKSFRDSYDADDFGELVEAYGGEGEEEDE